MFWCFGVYIFLHIHVFMYWCMFIYLFTVYSYIYIYTFFFIHVYLYIYIHIFVYDSYRWLWEHWTNQSFHWSLILSEGWRSFCVLAVLKLINTLNSYTTLANLLGHCRIFQPFFPASVHQNGKWICLDCSVGELMRCTPKQVWNSGRLFRFVWTLKSQHSEATHDQTIVGIAQ